MFEITGVIPEPIVPLAKEAWSHLEKMTCLNWKSEALATVVRPLPKGNGLSLIHI